MTSLLEWRIMFIGLAELAGQVLVEWPSHSLGTKMQSMLPISSKCWKGPTSECPKKFVVWHHVAVGCPSSGDGVLVLLAGMMVAVAVDAVIRVMVEEMVDEVDGDFPLPKVEIVGMTLGRHVTGTRWFRFLAVYF